MMNKRAAKSVKEDIGALKKVVLGGVL